MLIVGAVDFAHASDADPLNDAVVAQSLPDNHVTDERLCHRRKTLLPLTLFGNRRSVVGPSQRTTSRKHVRRRTFRRHSCACPRAKMKFAHNNKDRYSRTNKIAWPTFGN